MTYQAPAAACMPAANPLQASTAAASQPAVAPAAAPPPSQSHDLRAVFDHFDLNQDGHISTDEMTLSLLQLRIALDPAELASILRDADADSDGFISYKEFMGLYEELTRIRSSNGDDDDIGNACMPADHAERELREAFEIFDEDGDGLITAKELHRVLKRIGVLQERSLADCVTMIRRVDSDGNGQVDFEEFKEMMSSGM